MMENLPLIPTLKIINNLSFEEIIKLRLVNRRLRSIVDDEIRIGPELIISSFNHMPSTNLWFYTYRPIDLNRLIKCEQSSCNEILKKSIISNQLKQLYAYSISLSLEVLSKHFKQLEHLEIDDGTFEEPSESWSSYCLTNLRIFKIDADFDWQDFDEEVVPFCDLHLNAPKLEALMVTNCDIRLVHSSSLKFLQTSACFYLNNFLSEFINLEHLICDVAPFEKDERLMQKLSKLKSISTADRLDVLQEQKLKFHSQVRIFQHGFEVIYDDSTPIKLPRTFQVLNEKWIHDCIDHYSRLATHLLITKSVDYSSIEPYVDQVPNDIWRRFVHLHYLSALQVEKIDSLIKIIRSCNLIKGLILPHSLDQTFYNSLHNLAPFLEELMIRGSSVSDENILDCEFLTELNLKKFFIRQDLSYKLVEKLMDKSKRLESIEFCSNKSSVQIKRLNNTFHITIPGKNWTIKDLTVLSENWIQVFKSKY